MPMSAEDFRFAVEDVRRRHEATVDLISSIDRQALSFLQLYVTLSAAALSGAGFILLSNAPTYPRSLGIGLAAFAMPIIVGAVVSMITIWPADINLPGRDPDFWLSADLGASSPEVIYRAYLENLVVKAAQNAELNARMSNQMRNAKISGIVAPVIGLAATLISISLGR